MPRGCAIKVIEHSMMIGPLSQLTSNGMDVERALKREGEKFVAQLTARGCLVLSDAEFHDSADEDWVTAVVLCDHGKHGLG